MKITTTLVKMPTELDDTVQYYLKHDSGFLYVNDLLDNELHMEFIGYECLNCGKAKKIWRQGYCYDCFIRIPQTGEWIIRPELSRAHLDEEDRDLEYEKKVQLQPHVVYLANSGNVKVGVTRKSQVPTRWIDQGAHKALIVAEVPNRYLAGITEVALKNEVSDKTNWRTMLKNNFEEVDLFRFRKNLLATIPDEATPFIAESAVETSINYPVLIYPSKPRSLNLEKEKTFTGKLVGIKGQYFIFEDDTVFNVRGNEGYRVALTLG